MMNSRLLGAFNQGLRWALLARNQHHGPPKRGGTASFQKETTIIFLY